MSGKLDNSSKYLLHLVNDILICPGLRAGNGTEPNTAFILSVLHRRWRADAASKASSLYKMTAG